jgi:hypothetical protein
MELQWNFKHKTYDNKKAKIQTVINTSMVDRRNVLTNMMNKKMNELKQIKSEIRLIDTYINNQIL